MNETGNDINICAVAVPSHGIPTDAKGFAAWRKAQTFATVALANKAWQVEADFALEAKLTELQPTTRAECCRVSAVQ